MRNYLKKISMILLIVMLLKVAEGTTDAQAASASSWSFSDGAGGRIEVGGILTIDKNEFRDIDLYKNGKLIQGKDTTYRVTWLSSDPDVVWIDKSNGKLRGDKFGTLTQASARATITAKIENKETGAVTRKKFVVWVGENRTEYVTASGAVVDMTVYPDWFELPDVSVDDRPTPTPKPIAPENIDPSKVGVYGTQTMYFGENGWLYAIGELADGSTGKLPLVYTVEDESIMSIADNGVITPLKPGATDVTITVGNVYATYTLTVKPSHYNAVKGQTEGVGQEELEAAKVVTDFIEKNIESGMSDYEKIKLVHDYIIVNTEYKNRNNDRDHTVFGPLLDGYAVCEGYAKTFDLFMYALDIDCMIVEGVAGELHAWNIVMVDGAPYHIDTTWDDPTKENKDPETVNYEYFLLPEAYITRTHSYAVADYPYCQDVYYTYYHYRNNLIETIGDYEAKFVELFAVNPEEIVILYPENETVDKEVIFRNNGGKGYSIATDTNGKLLRIGDYTLMRIMHKDINISD